MKRLLLIPILLLCAITEPRAQSAITGPGIVTPSIATVTESGTIPAGAKSLTFIFSTNFSGTILGASFTGGVDASLNISAPSDYSLSAVDYTISAGSFRLIKIQ